MAGKFDIIAFDADDTLWQNEPVYLMAKERFADIMQGAESKQNIIKTLSRIEVGNVPTFGYGVKSFSLSMIEAALELRREDLQARQVQGIMQLAREMLRAEINLFEHVEETLAHLAELYPLMIITKGDPLDQESKLSRSGIINHFKYIEVVSQKTPESYAALLYRYSISAERFLMVGNSLRSDILPVIAIGGKAVYIPYHLTWEHEIPDVEVNRDGYYELEHIGLLPELLENIA